MIDQEEISGWLRLGLEPAQLHTTWCCPWIVEGYRENQLCSGVCVDIKYCLAPDHECWVWSDLVWIKSTLPGHCWALGWVLSTSDQGAKTMFNVPIWELGKYKTYSLINLQLLKQKLIFWQFFTLGSSSGLWIVRKYFLKFENPFRNAHFMSVSESGQIDSEKWEILGKLHF